MGLISQMGFLYMDMDGALLTGQFFGLNMVLIDTLLTQFSY